MEVGANEEGAGKRGGRYPDLKPDKLGGGPFGNDLQARDVGDDPMHQEGVGWIPQQGGQHSDGETNSSREGRRVDIPSDGGRDGRGGTVVSGNLRLPPPEHSHTVYCYQAHYEPVSGGGSDTGATVI